MYSPLTGLTNARVDLMTSLVSFERVFEVLDAPDPITERPGAVDLVAPPRPGHVRAASASATRRPTRRASARSSSTRRRPTPTATCSTASTSTCCPGETVALVGVSGGGKSTLVSLIPRLYDVTAGRVLVDGHDVRDLTLRSLRAAIGVVAQDPHLFHESIGDNLRYAKPDATDDELWRPAGRRASSTRSPSCPTASTRSSATAATACRAARSSAWRSPACCSRTRPS